VSARVVHLTIRDPDYENEHITDVIGDVEIETIDVDLGRYFNGPKGFDPDEGREWLEWTRSRVAHLPEDSNVRQRVEELCGELEAGDD
jgi:hypothetical protein